LLSSQSAILWMGALVFLSAALCWLGLLLPHPAQTDSGKATHPLNTAQRLGLWLSWAAVALALGGTLVRWHESYLLAPGMGHIPLSNLYEVFVLFVWMTLLLGLYFEKRYQAHGLMAFVLLVVGAAVAFLLWYALTRQAHLIQPLVPALQSWWMKLHVPANFVGYGCFVLAAMAALAWLLKTASARALWWGLVGSMAVLTIALAIAGYALPLPAEKLPALQRWLRIVGGLAAVCAALVAARRFINPRTPSLELLDEVMYQTVALGFVFFTLATVLGAFWAAEAWGAYWSWDPKEVWAWIVWINYATWLHLRLIKGLRGKYAAWWALVGLVIVTFAFIGVNMFLGGLHSYGQL
ncbi:MAG: c-type cytochrome biogenesis protein CcsB, partial [Brachymonas sp.]|nr:c-type cytochrome biogenesis protein CcsB [Brachymonas sp.]